MVSYLAGTVIGSFCCSGSSAPIHNHYHPFYPDVTYVKKDTRLSPSLDTAFHTASDGKLGGAWVQGYIFNYCVRCSTHGLLLTACVHRRSDCLRHLVIVLMERQHLNRLCSFDYAGMEEEVWIVSCSCLHVRYMHITCK